MLATVCHLFQAFVIGINVEFHVEEVAAGFASAPHDTACSELESRPVLFNAHCRPAEIEKREDRTVGSRLLQDGTEAIRGGVTVKAKRTGDVFDSILIGKDQTGR